MFHSLHFYWNRDSSVCVELGYGREDWVSRFYDRQGQNIYLFPKGSRPGLGFTQSPIKFQVGVGVGVGRS